MKTSITVRRKVVPSLSDAELSAAIMMTSSSSSRIGGGVGALYSNSGDEGRVDDGE